MAFGSSRHAAPAAGLRIAFLPEVEQIRSVPVVILNVCFLRAGTAVTVNSTGFVSQYLLAGVVGLPEGRDGWQANVSSSPQTRPVRVLGPAAADRYPGAGVLPRLLLGVLFVWACLILFPSFPNPIGIGLDPSWEHGLNLAHLQHLVFGKAIVFTYGPLAYLHFPAPYSASAQSVLLWNTAIYLASIYFLVRLVRSGLPLATTAVLLVAVGFAEAFRFAFVTGIHLQVPPLQIGFLLASWSLAANCSLRNTVDFLLTGTLAALSLLVKVNDGLVNIVLFYGLYALALRKWNGSRAITLLVGVTPLFVFGAAFRLANGPLAEIPAYLRFSLLLASGYSEAMALMGPLWQVLLAACSVAALVLILVLPSWRPSLLALFPTLLLSFAGFKHCMVRQDAHAVPFHAELAAISGFGLIACRDLIRHRALMIFCMMSLCVALSILIAQAPQISPAVLDDLRLAYLGRNMSEYLHLQQSWRRLRAVSDASLSVRKAPRYIEQAVRGRTVDDLSWNVDFIAANRFRWNPRPVFQAYAAFEPDLDQLNASHLAHEGADYLTWKLEDIDTRHPFLDDSQSWQEVIDRYDLVGGDLDTLLLRRTGERRLGHLRPIGGPTVARWGETITLPAVASSQVLVLRAQVRRSLIGWARQLLFRLDPVYLDVTYQSGARTRYRVTRPNLSRGALISDLPQSLPDAFPLFGYATTDDRNRVAQIRWFSANTAQFSNLIHLSWLVADLDRTMTGPVPLPHPDASAFVALWRPGDGFASAAAMQVQTAADRLILLPTNPDPQILLATRQRLNAFQTVLIRAKFSASDQINMFFGQQGNGRGFGGFVPVTDHWVDVYIKVGRNPFWKNEAGSAMRFDPVTDRFPHSRIELAGVWGSPKPLDDKPEETTVYLSQASGVLP